MQGRCGGRRGAAVLVGRATHALLAKAPNLTYAAALLCLPAPAAVEPRLRYYELAEGGGAEAKEGSKVVVRRGRACST